MSVRNRVSGFWLSDLGRCAAVAAGCRSRSRVAVRLATTIRSKRQHRCPNSRSSANSDQLWSHGVGNGKGKLYNRLGARDSRRKQLLRRRRTAKSKLSIAITGRSLWDADIDVPICGGVGIGGGLVLVASEDGRVWALDEANGKLLWKSQLGGQVSLGTAERWQYRGRGDIQRRHRRSRCQIRREKMAIRGRLAGAESACEQRAGIA